MNPPYNGTQLCAQVDPEVFFPINNFERADNIATAISICIQCPLLKECREYADSLPEVFGVWGGKMYEVNMWKKEITRKPIGRAS